MKKVSKKIFLLPLPFLIFVFIIFISFISFSIYFEKLSFIGIIGTLICICFLTYWKTIIVTNEKCIFKNHLLFFIIRKYEINYDSIKEILILDKSRGIRFRQYRPLANNAGGSTDRLFEFFVISNQNEELSIFESPNDLKIEKIALLFSVHFDLPIQRKRMKFEYLPEKEFFSGFQKPELNE